MARSRKAESTLVGLLILVGIPVWLFQNYPFIAFLLIAVVVVVVVLAVRQRPCEMCGVALKRISYRWQIDGETKRVCPNCNRSLERRQSSRAMTRW